MFPRYLESLLEELLHEFRVLYVTGPRQSGKTTLARLIATRTGMEYLTLDDPAILASALSDPHGLIRSLAARKVVLDEFQYVPGLIPAIKEASDNQRSDERGKFLLTGSADIFRSAKAQEALPGHMARLELLPLSVSEMSGQPRNLVDFLSAGDYSAGENRVEAIAPVSREQLAALVMHGGYPEVQDKSPRAKQIWFKSYIEGRLYKDFESLYAARGDYHSKIQALVPYLAGLCGNLLKYANVGNDLGLDDRVVKAYIEILDLMFIVRRVPSWLKSHSKREASQMPKLHFVDTGLACYLLGLRTEEQLLGSQYYGGLLESLMFMELSKHAAWAQEQADLYHFRDNRKNEVDMVLEKSNGRIIGIEIKASSSVKIQDFNGLVKLAEFAGDRFERGVLFYSGNAILPFKIGDANFHALPIGLITCRV
ncbi:MAG: DUF4143 domain-containing protein [Gammaproteobacteria bacterium]|nr:DUF4143 domain-containing protein [Gammaproteobacteria bacterium]